jgi:hypothetical protein
MHRLNIPFATSQALSISMDEMKYLYANLEEENISQIEPIETFNLLSHHGWVLLKPHVHHNLTSPGFKSRTEHGPY